MTFLYFVLMTYSLCYLAADARIFGTDTTAWNEVYLNEYVLDDDEQWLWSLGVFRLRQRLLTINALREHLSCYFCMGVWAGPLAHFILWNFYRVRGDSTAYVLNHPASLAGYAFGFLCAFLLGSVGSYVVNLVLHKLEGA